MPATSTTAVLDLLKSALWPFVAAVLVTLLTGPLFRRLAAAREWYDRPDSGLKPHEKPVPYLGGAAMYCGWLAAVVVTMCSAEQGRCELIWIAIGGTVLMLTGLADDVRHLRPTFRLWVQVLTAGLLVVMGIGRSVASSLLQAFSANPLPEAIQEGTIGIAISVVFCATVFVGATNATNLIDGMDGLCAGVLGVAASGFLIVTLLLNPADPAAHPAWPFIVATLGAASFGVCLAFLRFNFHPASMFMGDSGSLLLGFNVAILIILLTEHAGWTGLIVGLTVFGFPIFDTALAVGRRWLNKKPLFIGDRSHFYDQIRDRGFSVRQTVLLSWILSLLFAALGIAMVYLPGPYLGATFVALPLLGTLVCRRWGMLRVDDAADRSGE